MHLYNILGVPFIFVIFLIACIKYQKNTSKLEPYKIGSYNSKLKTIQKKVTQKKTTSKLYIKLDFTTLGLHIIISKKNHLKKLEPCKIESHLQIGTIQN